MVPKQSDCLEDHDLTIVKHQPVLGGRTQTVDVVAALQDWCRLRQVLECKTTWLHGKI